MSFFKKLGLDNLFGKKKQQGVDDVTDSDNKIEDESLKSPDKSDTEKVVLVPENNTRPIITGQNKVKVENALAKLYFKEKHYNLIKFNIHFGQETDTKGFPDGLPKGGIMTLVLDSLPDDEINKWMQKIDVLEDGEIRLFSSQKKVKESAVYTIIFKDAYCIGYKKKLNNEKGVYTTLEISPRYVKMGNEEFENNWKTTGSLSYYIRSK